MAKKPASKPASKLGRGLSALMADIAVPEIPEDSPKKPSKQAGSKPKSKSTKLAASSKNVEKGGRLGGTQEIPIDLLERNPSQPRRNFDKVKLGELTNSIRQKGVLQPILVRPLPESYGSKGKRIDNRYQIVAGERRWHGAQAAGLESMPALIRQLSDQEVLEIGVIENVQRADLNPMEEASAYQDMVQQFGRKQSEIAAATGKSRSHIANCLRLLNLPVLAQEYLEDGKITAGHARAILAASDPQALAEAIVKDGLSVRAAEKWVHRFSGKGKVNTEKPDANIHFIERKLSQHIGMDVNIKHKDPDGTLTIKYKTMEQFDDLIKRLRQN
jgi:ParB family transcriptional regulator, chromosome partitioning protein